MAVSSGSRLSTGKRVDAPPKTYGMAVAAVLVLLCPLFWIIGLVLRVVSPSLGDWEYVIRSLADILFYGGGTVTVLVGALLLWARFSKTKAVDWSKAKLPADVGLTLGPIDPTSLWSPDSSPVGQFTQAQNLLSTQRDGRNCYCFETLNDVGGRDFHFLVELDSWLPDLTVGEEIAEFGESRADIAVEDATFNQIYHVAGWDRTERSDRYRHAMVNPLMMDLMMSRVVQWRIRGRFVVHTVHEIIDQPKRVLSLFHDRIPYLVRVADNVPSYVYGEYADLRRRNP